MATRSTVRSAAGEMADAASALLVALDAWDASDYASDAEGEAARSLVYTDYIRARARLAEAVGEAGPLADGEDGRDDEPYDDGGGYRV